MLKVQEIREIIKLIDQSSINEFTYEINGTTLSMKKASGSNEVQASEKIVDKAEQQVVETATKEAQTKSVVREEPKVELSVAMNENEINYDLEIVSPMVGTFYRRPSPENDPYVNINSKVEQDTIVCIVEAMKLFNEIEAEVAGEIVEILVEDGELVEYGQPLFRVKK